MLGKPVKEIFPSMSKKKKRRRHAGKGAKEERAVCRQLSLWWSDDRFDDLFWRASQSGGRATVRSRKNKTTSGHYGDITATDHRGAELIKIVTVEIKCGYTKFHTSDFLDSKQDETICEQWFAQAEMAAALAKSISWIVISRANFRHQLIYMPRGLFRKLTNADCVYPRATMFLNDWNIVVMRFDEFCNRVEPDAFRRINRT